MSKKRKKFNKGRSLEPQLSDTQPTNYLPPHKTKNRRRYFGLTTLTSSIIIVFVGLAVFSIGLTNAFIGDDAQQIVDNPPAHSIANLPLFFQGGTFYNGQPGPLSGVYYRPLMTTTFALIYSIFGPTPLAFHLVQLMLHVGCAILLFLILRYFFKPLLSLVLALVFLVHPINSQSVFAIASMQEPLFLFFGLLSFWLLIRFQDKSRWYLLLPAASLLLSLFAKETAALFIFVSLLYLWLTDRRRFLPMLGLSVVCLAIYMSLRLPAVGLTSTPHLAPIDQLTPWQRLLTVPEVVLFYFLKFVFPLTLSHGNYWFVQAPTLGSFVLPVLLDLGLAGLSVYLALELKKRGISREFTLYIFFLGWLVAGVLLHSQIVPLDATVTETWFYFSIIGLLGVIGAIIEAYLPNITPKPIVATVTVVCLVLGLRTAVRGLDWHDQFTLASRDINATQGDYVSEFQMAAELINQGNLPPAKEHALRSIHDYPSGMGYNNLGVAEGKMGDYHGARLAFQEGLKYQKYEQLEKYLALAYVSDPSANLQDAITFIKKAINDYPNDTNLWTYLAEEQFRSGDKTSAKKSILRAQQYGSVDPRAISIIDNQ